MAHKRVVLFDFRKALDLIDHNILATKLATLNIPHKIECYYKYLAEIDEILI